MLVGDLGLLDRGGPEARVGTVAARRRYGCPGEGRRWWSPFPSRLDAVAVQGREKVIGGSGGAALAINGVLTPRPEFRYPSGVSWDRQRVEALVRRVAQAQVRAEEAGERAQIAQRSLQLTVERMTWLKHRARASTATAEARRNTPGDRA
jgi:hypothetical protein